MGTQELDPWDIFKGIYEASRRKHFERKAAGAPSPHETRRLPEQTPGELVGREFRRVRKLDKVERNTTARGTVAETRDYVEQTLAEFILDEFPTDLAAVQDDQQGDTAMAEDVFGETLDTVPLMHPEQITKASTKPRKIENLKRDNDSQRTTKLNKEFVLRCLKEDEAGDAQLFVKLFGGQYIFDRAAGAWYEFKNHAWHWLSGPPRRAAWGRLAAAYLATSAELQAEIEHANEDDQKRLATQIESLISRSKKLKRLKRCNDVLTLAGDEGMLGITGKEWDTDPWLLGVANGVLDLRTGQLRDGHPHDYIRTQAATVWEGLEVPASRWERFVAEVMSNEADRVTFLQRAFGYALNGTTREHMIVLLVGEQGRNGKGVLFDTLRRVLGDYAGAVSNDVIVGQQHRRVAGSAQPHLMELRGKRLAYTSETADGDQISAAQVKLLTGGDVINARGLYEKMTSFLPTHTLFVATNRRPHAPADDDALWERVKVLEFKARFVDEPGAPNEHQRDPLLGEALKSEVSGILAWLVRGHLDYLRDGLRTPASVKLARDTYRKSESIEPFIAARCAEWDGGDAEAGDLWAAYQSWCNNEGLRPKSQTWLGRQLAARYEKARTREGRICYYGVSLAPNPSAEYQNPSKGIRTPETREETEGFTRFSEGLGANSEKSPSKNSYEGELYKNGLNPSDLSGPKGLPPGYTITLDPDRPRCWITNGSGWGKYAATPAGATALAWEHVALQETAAKAAD